MSDEVIEPSPVAGTPKAKWPLSRIILLALLAVAIGLLAMDWTRGRLPRDRAYNRLAEEAPAAATNEPSKAVPPASAKAAAISPEFWTMEKVHELLQREPGKTEERPAPNKVDTIVTETYRFPGVFKSYLLVIVYGKRLHPAPGMPNMMVTDVQRNG